MGPTLEYARPIFQERQTTRLSPWWNVFAVIVTAVAITAVVVLYHISRNPAVRAVSAGILIPAVLVVVLPRIILKDLEIRVDGHGLHVRFGAFPWRNFPASEIASIEPCTYDAKRDFGGYGMRMRVSTAGDCYTLRGNTAVTLQLRSGRKVLIGTDTPDALAAAMRSLTSPDPATPPV